MKAPGNSPSRTCVEDAEKVERLERRLEEAQSVLEEARRRWLSPNTNPLDVLEGLAAILRGEEGA